MERCSFIRKNFCLFWWMILKAVALRIKKLKQFLATCEDH